MRTTVVWIGSAAPAELARECEQRGLIVRSEATMPDEVGSDLRALLVDIDDRDALRALGSHIRGLRDGGILVGLVSRNRTELVNDVQAQLGEGLSAGPPPVFVLGDEGGMESIAERCLRHEAGPSAGVLPTVIVQPELDLPDRQLVQRAFGGMTRVKLTPLHDGFSAAKVWRAETVDIRGRTRVPMVVKLDELTRIRREISNIRTHVAEFVPSQSYAQLVDERCVEGARCGLLVGHFVAGARSLRDLLRTTDRHNATTVITSLFDGPLGGWRNNAREDLPVALGRAYRTWRVLQEGDALDGACALARARRYTTVRNAAELVAVLDRLRPVRVRVCMAHGDLQARNIFVRDSGSAPVMIDFFLTEYESTLSRDPATLDVTLAFDSEARLDIADIAALYRPGHLLDVGQHHDGFRAAIEQIRALCVRDRVTEWEYAVSCACYLLRLARLGVEYETISLQLVAAAYAHASELIGWLETAPIPEVLL